MAYISTSEILYLGAFALLNRVLPYLVIDAGIEIINKILAIHSESRILQRLFMI